MTSFETFCTFRLKLSICFISALLFSVIYIGSIVADLLKIVTKIRSATDQSHVLKLEPNDNFFISPENFQLCEGCSVGLCPQANGTQLAQRIFNKASTEIQAFFNLTFSCHGVVVAWALFDAAPARGNVLFFDVLKYDQNADEGTWMGFNKIVTNGQSPGWAIYKVPENDRIVVEPGFFVAFHYDDVAAEAVIPFAEPSSADDLNVTSFSDGFTILMDHQELTRVAKVGRVAEVAMSTLFKNLLVSVKRNWRLPAIGAIVEPIPPKTNNKSKN